MHIALAVITVLFYGTTETPQVRVIQAPSYAICQRDKDAIAGKILSGDAKLRAVDVQCLDVNLGDAA